MDYPEVRAICACCITLVVLHHGLHKKRSAFIGRAWSASLMSGIARATYPAHGIALSQKLASLLHVVAGDSLRVEVLNGHRRHFFVVVSNVV